MDIDVFPNSIEYWGPAGMAFFRNVQFRWMPIKGQEASSRSRSRNPAPVATRVSMPTVLNFRASSRSSTCLTSQAKPDLHVTGDMLRLRAFSES